MPVVAALLTLAYAYPGVTLLLSNEFVKKAYEKIKPMVDQTYEDKEAAFRQLFQQMVNISGTVALVSVAFFFWHALTLPLWIGVVGYATLPVMAFFTYAVLGKALDWKSGNVFVGGAAGVSAFYFTMVWVGYDSWMTVLTLSIPAAAFAALLAVVIAVPAIYSALRWVGTREYTAEAAKKDGTKLHDVHAKAWLQLKKCELVYWAVYGDKRGLQFQKLVAYVASFLVALVVSGAAWHFSSNAGLLVSIPAGLLAFSFAFLIGRRAVFDSLVAVGTVTSLSWAVILAVVLKDATVYGLAFAASFATVAALVTHFVLFPMVYLGAKKVCDPDVTDVLLPTFEALYNRLSSWFGTVLDKIAAFFRFLYPYWNKLVNFLAPYLAILGGFFVAAWGFVAAGWNAVADAWNSMFGKKS